MSETEIEQRTHQKSLRDFYRVLFRHKCKSLLVFVVVVGAVTVVTFTATEIYESQAKLLVKPGRESLTVDPTVPEDRILSINRRMEEHLNSELEILKSRTLSERAVDAIGPEKFLTRSGEEADVAAAGGTAHDRIKNVLCKTGAAVRGAKAVCAGVLKTLGIANEIEPREQAIHIVSKRLSAAILSNSDVIELTFESQSPELAKGTLDTLIDVYLEQRLAIYDGGGSHRFFKEQTENLQTELEAAEQDLRDFKNKAKLGDLTKQRDIAVERLGGLLRQMHDLDAQLAASTGKVFSLHQTLDRMSETTTLEQVTGRPNYFMDDARFRLLELRLREKELLAMYPEDNRLVQNVREQIERAEAMLSDEEETRTERTTGINSSYRQLEVELLEERAKREALQKQRGVLGSQVADVHAEIEVLNDNEIKLTQMQRRRDIAEQNYRNYVDKLEQTRISQALEQEKISNISVIQPATMPVLPVSPKKTLGLFLGVLLGLFAALGLSFVSEYLDHSIKTPEQVEERLQLPALVSIPLVRAEGVLAMANGRGVESKTGKASNRWDNGAEITPYYHGLRERLARSFQGSTRAPRVLGVTSCHHGEGVSSIAANLAATLARDGGGRVLLVDANVGSPSIHRIFKSEASLGLADTLAHSENAENVVVASPVESLDIVPAGNGNGNLAQTFSGDGFSKLVGSLKRGYRFVVIDMPALDETSSAFRLASLCDGIVLVVEAERLRWEVAHRAAEQLAETKANILGVVLNKRRFPIPGWLYRTL
jgi:capsular exopolysaccharide synthesis family protein